MRGAARPHLFFPVTSFVLLGSLGILGGCFGSDRLELAVPEIGKSLEPLRAAFNADPGHVRAILLASPT